MAKPKTVWVAWNASTGVVAVSFTLKDAKHAHHVYSGGGDNVFTYECIGGAPYADAKDVSRFMYR